MFYCELKIRYYYKNTDNQRIAGLHWNWCKLMRFCNLLQPLEPFLDLLTFKLYPLRSNALIFEIHSVVPKLQPVLDQFELKYFRIILIIKTSSKSNKKTHILFCCFIVVLFYLNVFSRDSRSKSASQPIVEFAKYFLSVTHSLIIIERFFLHRSNLFWVASFIWPHFAALGPYKRIAMCLSAGKYTKYGFWMCPHIAKG